MMFNKAFAKSLVAPLLIMPSMAMAVNLNYDRLSSLEEPLATHVGDTTLLLQGLVDLPVVYDLEDDNDTESNLLANFQISAETQLANSWTLGATYFGAYDNDATDSFDDNFAVFLGGVWGTLSLGNVTGMVREETRRRRGAGNAFLAYDDFLGGLQEEGVSYAGRFGPSRLSLNVDDEGNAELGWQFQRPIGNKDYRFTTRINSAEYSPNPESTYQTTGVSTMVELTYGSSVYDLALGLESIDTGATTLDRWYLSAGAAHKIGRWTFSGEAHVGEVEDQDEQSYALGVIYDVARGLSLNLGINDRDSSLSHEGIILRNDDSTEGILSLRYSF